MTESPTAAGGLPEGPAGYRFAPRSPISSRLPIEPLEGGGRFPFPARFLLAAGLVLLAALAADLARAAGTYYVDRANPACSDVGSGTLAIPYCSISAAVTARGGPGVTIVVQAGTYREQVTVAAAGQSGAPLVIRGQGSPVVDGADDFTSPALWTVHSGNVWRAASVTWATKQVFLAGARLAESTLTPASLPAGSFRYVAGEGLYVNAGGGNPGAQPLLVGRRLHGFRVSGYPWISIEGFTVTRTDDRGIYLSSGADNAVISGNTVSHAFRPGIQVSNSNAATIAGNTTSFNFDHGIALSSVNGSTLRLNHCFSNSKPAGTSSGIYLSASSSNVIEANRIHDNTSSGFYAQSASNANLLVQNRSWRNARHGFDLYGSTGTRHVGDVAWGNTEDGFALRNVATGTSLYDCIASGNTGRSLLVESNSTSGFASNDNVFFAGVQGGVIVRWGSVDHVTLASFASATGQDTRTRAANPLFVDPAAGDFNLAAGSPALDAANTGVAGWPALDAEGRGRRDDLSVPNTGLGPVSFADRGALERTPGIPPQASLTVTPSTGPAPLTVTADGSGSTPLDGPIASYRFDFGDGAVIGPQPGATAVHTYSGGTWTATVRVTDADGESDTATAVVTAVSTEQPPDGVMEAPGTDLSIVAGQMVVLLGSGADPDGDLPLTYEWDLGGAAPHRTEEDPGPVAFDVAGTFTVTLRVRDAGGTVDPTPPSRVITVTSAAALPADEIHWTVTGQTSVTFDWRGAANTIAYGRTPAYGQSATAVAPTPLPYSSPGPFWEARLSGLDPNALYHYSIGGGPDHTFRTPPPRGSSGFTTLVSADVGSTLDHDNVAPMQALIAWQRPALAIMAGDLTYGDDKGAPSVDGHFNDVMAWSQDVPYMPAWGNHEWGSTVDDLRNYKGRFDLPNTRASTGAPVSGCCGDDWYWFDYGNVRFIAYPEPYISGTWANWYPRADSLMNEVRNDSQIRFIVTFGHRPAYSSGHHSGDNALRGYLDSLGVRHSKYVLNLNGHSHNYERSHPQRGVIHVTSGGGGSSLEVRSGACPWEGGCPAPAWSAYRAFRHGALRLRFTAGGIVGEALCGPPDQDQNLSCEFGSVFDQFVIGTPDMEPAVSAPANVFGLEGQPLSIAVTVTDADADPIASLTADLSGLPAGHGATFTVAPDRTWGTLAWTPGFADSGSYTVSFHASNALTGSAGTTLSIANLDRAPAVAVSGSTTVNEAAPLTLTVTAADPDGDAIAVLSADLSGLPAASNATFTAAPDHASGTLTWTPSYADSGVRSVTFTATNALAGAATAPIAVINVDRAPVITAPAAVSVAENAPLAVVVAAADPDGDAIGALTATLSGLPAGHGAVFVPAPGNAAGTLTWTPAFTAAPGPYTIAFGATNALVGFGSTSVAVVNVDRAPVVTAPATVTIAENEELVVSVSAADPDGDPLPSLTADLAGLPAGHGATFTVDPGNASATLRWRPTFADSGTRTISFTAANALNGSASTVIRVTNVDRPPVVSAPPTTTVSEAAPLAVTVTASDPDGDAIGALTANLSSLPAGHGAVFTPAAGNASGTLTWTPSFSAAPGPYAIAFSASNALGATATTSITVTNVDRSPVVLAPAAVSTPEATTLTVPVTAADPDGDPIVSLVANLSNLPAGHGAAFVAAPGNASGTLTWTPSFFAAPGPYAIAFTATNALGGSATTSIAVNNVDRAPVVLAPASVLVAENQELVVNVSATDPDGDPLASLAGNLAGLPAGHNATFTIDPGNTSATLRWRPTFADSGVRSVSFTAANALNGSVSTVIRVTNVDRPPVVSAPPTATVAEGGPLTVTVTASDPDGDAIGALTVNSSSLPAGHGATFTPGAGNTTGTLAWTPSFAAAPGPYAITFDATNALAGSATTSVTVTNVDRAPAVTAPALVLVAEDQELVVNVSAADPDGDAVASLAANLSNLPAGHGATFTVAPGNGSATLRWRPAFTDSGTRTVTFTATNALGGSASTSVRVTNVDRAPVVSAPPTASATEGAPLTVTVTASDPDGEPIGALTANLSGLPAGHGATFTPAPGNGSGTLTWTPAFTASPGPYAISFTASNTLGGAAATTITVTNVDRAPAISAPAAVSVAENQEVVVSVSAADPDGQPLDALTASLAGLPAGHDATFTVAPGNGSGTLRWRPTFADSGVRTVTFTATNTLNGSATTTIRVSNVDRPPVVSAPPASSATEGTPLTVAVTASDPDGDAIGALTANLSSLPAGHGATFTPAAGNASGTLTWTPSFAVAPGPYAIAFDATNALGGSATTSIAVTDVDRAPVVVAPATVSATEGTPLTVSITAADPDGQPIVSFGANLSTLPAGHGAVFTPGPGNTTGTLTWTPSFAVAPGPYAIAFNATNALGGSATTSVAVTNVDRAPIVSALASVSVVENQELTLNVTAADPDGNPIATLTSNLIGLPAGHGATFTVAPGNVSATLRWRPTVADSGAYTVSFTAANALNGSASTLIRVTNIDRPPVVSAPSTTTVAEGAPLTVSITASDPDGDAIGALTANLSALSAGHDAVFTPGAGNTTGTLTWTPAFTAGPGSYAVVFAASNALAGSATTSVTVTNVDRAPIVSAPPTVTAVEGVALVLGVSAADPDGDAIGSLTANLSSLPAGHHAVFTPASGNGSGTLTWTPGPNDAPGPYGVTFSATNGLPGAATVSIAVSNQDRPPSIAAPPAVSVAEATPLTVAVTAADPDGDPIVSLTASLSALPAGHGAVFTPGPGNTTGTLAWAPAFDHAGGPYTVVFTATNALTGSSATAITVSAVDRAPLVTAASDTTAIAGHPFVLIVTAVDPDGDPIASWNADLSGVAGAQLTPLPGNAAASLTWTPTPGDTVTAHTVSFTAANALSGTATTRIAVRGNRPPRAMFELLPLTGIDPLGVTLDAAASSDPDGGALTYAFDFGDGGSSGPQAAATTTHFYAAGPWVARVVVTDGGGAVDSALVPLHVLPNLITNASFEASLTGWNSYAGSTLARVAGGLHGQWSLEVTGPASLATFGVNDSPDWISRSAIIGHRYRYGAWVRSSAGGGAGRLQVREFLNNVQQGPTALSPSVTLSPEWQYLSLEYQARTAASSLNFQVLGVPTSAATKFLVDGITLRVDEERTGVTPGEASVRLTARVRPNPVRGGAAIALTLPHPGPVEVSVLDVGGRSKRRTLEIAHLPAGTIDIPLASPGDPPLPTGIYFFVVRTAGGEARGRFVVLR